MRRYAKECDQLAIHSQQKWGEAHKNGVFDLEIAPVNIETKKGTKARYMSQTFVFIL